MGEGRVLAGGFDWLWASVLVWGLVGVNGSTE